MIMSLVICHLSFASCRRHINRPLTALFTARFVNQVSDVLHIVDRDKSQRIIRLILALVANRHVVGEQSDCSIANYPADESLLVGDIVNVNEQDLISDALKKAQ